MADPTAPDRPPRALQALDAAAAWRDVLEAQRGPELPAAGRHRVGHRGPADAARGGGAPPAGRAAAAAAATTGPAGALEPVLAEPRRDGHASATGCCVDAVAVELPAGRLEALAALPEVTAVVPVTFLAPAAQVGARARRGAGAPGAAAAPTAGARRRPTRRTSP